MTEPIKLSRERWDNLADYWAANHPSVKSPATNHLVVSAPVQANGITFLPATYVPRETLTDAMAAGLRDSVRRATSAPMPTQDLRTLYGTPPR